MSLLRRSGSDEVVIEGYSSTIWLVYIGDSRSTWPGMAGCVSERPVAVLGDDVGSLSCVRRRGRYGNRWRGSGNVGKYVIGIVFPVWEL